MRVFSPLAVHGWLQCSSASVAEDGPEQTQGSWMLIWRFPGDEGLTCLNSCWVWDLAAAWNLIFPQNSEEVFPSEKAIYIKNRPFHTPQKSDPYVYKATKQWACLHYINERHSLHLKMFRKEVKVTWTDLFVFLSLNFAPINSSNPTP